MFLVSWNILYISLFQWIFNWYLTLLLSEEVWVYKGNQNSILNLSKSKRKIIKLLSVDDSIFIFLSYGTLVVHIGSGMAVQQSLFYVKHTSKLSSFDVNAPKLFDTGVRKGAFPSFDFVTQCSANAWIVTLLWKLPQMPSCSANYANLDKNNFDMFYRIDCCAAIHGRIWMNNIPNESRIIMLSCTEITEIIFFFFLFFLLLFFFIFGVNPGPLFLTDTVYRNINDLWTTMR